MGKKKMNKKVIIITIISLLCISFIAIALSQINVFIENIGSSDSTHGARLDSARLLLEANQPFEFGAEECTGTSSGCNQWDSDEAGCIDSESSYHNSICSWSPAPGCFGWPSGCGALGEIDCYSYGGCFWWDGTCYDNLCSTAPDAGSCASWDPGATCYWDAAYGTCDGTLTCASQVSSVVCAEDAGCTWDSYNYVIDSSIFNNRGKPYGDVFYNPSCNSPATGGCYEFDGTDDYIVITDDDSLKPQNQITLSVWVNISALPDPGDMYVIFDHQSANPWYGYGLAILADGNVTSDLYTNGVPPGCASSTALSPNRWYFVTMTYNGTHQNMYINGTLEKSIILTGAISYTSSVNPTVGVRYSLGDYFSFKGQIDNLMILDRALTSAEILTLYKGIPKNNSNYIGKFSTTPAEVYSTLLNHSTPFTWQFNLDSTVGDGLYNVNTSNPNLVSYWKLDTNGLDSVGSNNGVVTGANNATGLSSEAMYFSGADYITVTESNTLDFDTTNFSISLWARPEPADAGNGGNYGCMFEKGWNTNPFTGYAICVGDASDAGKIRWSIVEANDYQSNLISNKVIDDGNWHHIYVEREGTTQRIYIDNVLDNSAIGTLKNVSNDIDAYIGKEVTGGYSYKGELDEIIIYNTTLNATQRTMNYKAGLSQRVNSTMTISFREGNLTNLTDPYLVEFFSMDNENATDVLGELKAINGTKTGGLKNATIGNGTVRRGYYFDGVDDYISFGTSSKFAIAYNQPYTISAWVKPDDNLDGYGAVFAHQGTNSRYSYFLLQSTNKWRIQICKATVACNVVDSEPFIPQRWQYVTATYDGLNASIYVNGKLEGTVTYTQGALSAPNSGCAIGTDTANVGERSFGGSIDEFRFYNRTLNASEILNLYQMGTYHIEDMGEWSTPTLVTGNSATYYSMSNYTQFKLNITSNTTIASPYILNYNGSEPTATLSVSDIHWKTTGGFTDNTLAYGQIIDYINATCSGTPVFDCNITLTSPTATKVSNINMSNTSTEYTYPYDITLDETGTWTISITASDGTNTASDSETFTVDTVMQNLTVGYYGYSTETIPTNATLTDLAAYNFNLIEIQDIASTIGDNWTSDKTKAAIRRAYELNMRVGLVFKLDYNLSLNTVARQYFRNNVTKYFPELLNTPYIQTVDYVKFIFNKTEGDTDRNITDNNLDVIGKDAFDATNNKFKIYSDYNSSTLDTDYIQYGDNLKYITGTSQAQVINTLAQLARNTTYRSRIYFNISNLLKDVALDYQNKIMIPLFNDFNITTKITYPLVAEIVGGGFVVHNNQSRANYTYNLSNGTDVIGSEIWDYTNGLLLANNSNGTITFLNIDSNSSILVGTETLDHISMESDTSANVHSESTSVIYLANYTDGFGNAARGPLTTARAIEMWDDSYIKATSVIYYGLLSVVQNPFDFDGYKYVVIADDTDSEVDKLMNGSASIEKGVFHYMAVADYGSKLPDCNNLTWVNLKKTEVDNILLGNASQNIFIDGFDIGNVHDSGCFFIDVKNVTDYIKITKAREVGVNVFTNYQEFCPLASDNGFCMIESCTHKWFYNQTGSSAYGYNYTKQYWEDYAGYGDYNKSIWYSTHNIDVICVAFVDRNSSAFLPDSFATVNKDKYHNSTYELMQKLWFKAKVLGYDNFILGHPLFNIHYFDKYYDVGTKLQSQPFKQNDLYYMRYSKGIVYYNSTSDTAWFEDGRIFNNGSLSFKLYDAGAYTYNICINDDCAFSIVSPGSGWTPASGYPSLTTYFNKTVYEQSYGHYVVNISSTDGFIAADSLTTDYQITSFYKNGNSWSIEGGDGYGNEVSWLTLNLTSKTIIDTTSQITQANSTTTTAITKFSYVNLTSPYDYLTDIWTHTVHFVENKLNSIKVWNSSSWVTVSYNSDSTCLTANPNWYVNSVLGIGNVGVCIYTGDGGFKIRFKFPSLTFRSAMMDFDDIPPTMTLVYPTDGAYYNNYTGFVNITLNEHGNCSINDTRWSISSSNSTLFSFRSTELLYQENPNTSSSSGTFIYVNYTKPSNYHSALWQVKHSNLAVYNVTLPSRCLDAYPAKLALAMYSQPNNGHGGSESQPYCYNGTDYEAVGTLASAAFYAIRGDSAGYGNAIDGDWSTFSNYEWYWTSTMMNGQGTCQGGDPGWCSDTQATARFYEEAIWWSVQTALPDGNYSLNVSCWDAAINNDTIEFGFILDTTKPLVNWSSGTAKNASNVSQKWIYSNVTYTEVNGYNLTWNINGATHTYNPGDLPINYYNKTGLADGNYVYNVTMCDYAKNCNSTESRYITLDTTYPQISYGIGTEANDTNWSRNWIYVNVSVTETNVMNMTYTFNGTDVKVAHSLTQLNKTSLSDGHYIYNVTVCDSVGQCNVTDNRYIYLDSTGPNVTLLLPANAAVIAIPSSNFNYTISDNTKVDNCTFYINGNRIITNTTQNVTLTNLTGGTNYWEVHCLDNLQNLGKSSNYSLTYKLPAGAGGSADTSGAAGTSELETGQKAANVCNTTNILQRVFFGCRLEDGVCNDGENLLIDKDCQFNMNDLTSLTILNTMWFIRLMLLLAAIMFFRKSTLFPLIVIIIMALLVMNGALGLQEVKPSNLNLPNISFSNMSSTMKAALLVTFIWFLNFIKPNTTGKLR